MAISKSESIRQDVTKLIAAQFDIPVESVNSDAAFGDLPQWDSLGHMTVISALEDKYHLDVDANLIAQLTSVPAICEYLEKHANDR